jgi:hypothetical protein
VTVEELEHAARLAAVADALVEAGDVDGVDDATSAASAGRR